MFLHQKPILSPRTQIKDLISSLVTEELDKKNEKLAEIYLGQIQRGSYSNKRA